MSESSSELTHIPVLITKITQFLEDAYGTSPHDLQIFDATFGAGGYTNELTRLGSVIATDADLNAVNKGKERFSNTDNVTILNTRFDLGLEQQPDRFFDVIVADLGYSSTQLDESARGFSYQKADEDLDLRFDGDTGRPCWELMYGLRDAEKLRKIIYTNSGEKFSKRIAEDLFALIKDKKDLRQPLKVGEVAQTVAKSIPAKEKRKTNATLSRVWQALRIWTNSEFEVLARFLETSLSKLKTDGYLMAVTFHSLEDKLVTKFMRQCAKPVEEDLYGNKTLSYKLPVKKPILPDEEEIAMNVRSRSAQLRILQKLI